MYVGYYKMVGMHPDLPVWVEADNWVEAAQKLQAWRNRYEERGYGHLIADEPFKMESDKVQELPIPSEMH
jgi:hypothetical protein